MDLKKENLYFMIKKLLKQKSGLINTINAVKNLKQMFLKLLRITVISCKFKSKCLEFMGLFFVSVSNIDYTV